jgi:hypothetical protein
MLDYLRGVSLGGRCRLAGFYRRISKHGPIRFANDAFYLGGKIGIPKDQ